MIKKKKGFFTFIFSFIPGAGEMYMGFFKNGGSIMSITLLIIMLSSYLNLGPLMAILPVLWFYSFFHVHNLSSMPDEEFYALEDRYAFHLNDTELQRIIHSGKAHTIFAITIIVIGISSLWTNFSNVLYEIFPERYYQILHGFFYNVPQFLISIAFIVLGIYLIKRKKKELDQAPLIEDKPENL